MLANNSYIKCHQLGKYMLQWFFKVISNKVSAWYLYTILPIYSISNRHLNLQIWKLAGMYYIQS